MFKKLDILFFIEHKDRELYIARSVCKEIIEKNEKISIRIVSLIFHALISIVLYRPKVVVTPSPAFGWGSVSRLFHFVYGDKIKFINLNYEQYVGEWESTLKLQWHHISKTKQYQISWHKDFMKKMISMGVSKKYYKHR